MAVNFQLSSWRSTFIPPGDKPPSILLAVNLHPSSWRSTSTHPPGGQRPPILLAVNFHPSSWRSTSTHPPGGQHSPILLADNLHPSWRSISHCLRCFSGWGVKREYTVGWSELALFAIFENRHYAADQEYFYESNPNHFQQITEAVK